MCGIGGVVLQPGCEGVNLRGRVQAMADAMTHRGPDGEGVYECRDGRAGLVNRRLAIVDLSPAGSMPMGNPEGTVWLTHNGEIYNATELRAELTGLGYHFRSTSDTEVILRGYEAWGDGVVPRLRGMFAFAIWDVRSGRAGAPSPLGRDRTGRLFLVRDRLGVKPLYYAATGQAFVFASELKAVQASGFVGRELSPAGIVGYLTLGSVPCPLTIYRDVQAMEPGHTLTVDAHTDARGAVPRRYWRLPSDPGGPDRVREPVEYVRALLEDAVRSHLVSDVPLGAFLSGGLDSSAVVALMRAVTAGPIRTCSMTFEEAEFSEAPYARAVAAAVDAEHVERVVTADEVLGQLDRILWAMDQPTIDGVNSYFVAKTAREAGLTVALSGLGGDELFGGYPNTFQGVPRLMRATALARRVPGATTVARTALRVIRDQSRRAKVTDALGRPASAASAYLACRGLFAPSDVQALVEPEVWSAASRVFDPVREIATRVPPMSTNASGNGAGNGHGLFAWVSRAELKTYTHHQLLRDTDAMSMAHSLEVRVPLLDHQLVEAVLRLPEAAQRTGDSPKGLLRRAVGDLLPAAVRNRRDKQGFVFPFDVWLRGPLRRVCEEWQRSLEGVLRPDATAAIQRAYEGRRLHWSRAWALAVLGGWRTTQGAAL